VRLVWTTRAKTDLRGIVLHIGADNPTAADKLRARIERSAAYLAHQPFAGRVGAIRGTREIIPHPSYRLVYQLTDDVVSVMRVVHTAREWPPAEDRN
jgi:toxin ParE1/3/4